jgi:hypothetical protein
MELQEHRFKLGYIAIISVFNLMSAVGNTLMLIVLLGR